MKWFYYLRGLYRTQVETMNGAAHSFTDNNHAKSCRSLVSWIHKRGCQEIHTLERKKTFAEPIIKIGDSNEAGLRRYGRVWRKYFKDAVDHVKNV